MLFWEHVKLQLFFCISFAFTAELRYVEVVGT